MANNTGQTGSNAAQSEGHPAGDPQTNGHATSDDPDYNPFDNPHSTLNDEAAAGAANGDTTEERAGIITGLYAREICMLTDEGHKQVGALRGSIPATWSTSSCSRRRVARRGRRGRWRVRRAMAPMTAYSDAAASPHSTSCARPSTDCGRPPLMR